MVRLSPDPNASDPKRARRQNILMILGVGLVLILLAVLLTHVVIPLLRQDIPSSTTTVPAVTEETSSTVTETTSTAAETTTGTSAAEETSGETSDETSEASTEETTAGAGGPGDEVILADQPGDMNQLDTWLIDQSRLYSTAEVNLREAADTDSAVVTLLPRGAELEVLPESDLNWKQVRYEGQEGFVSANFVQIHAYGTTPGDRYYFTLQPTNLRESAGEDAAVLSEIPANTAVTVLTVDKSSRWMRAAVDGEEGYLDGNDLNYTIGPSEGWTGTASAASLEAAWDLRVFDSYGDDMIFGLWRLLKLEADGHFELEDAYLWSEGVGTSGSWAVEGEVLKLTVLEIADMGGTHAVPEDEQEASYAIHLSSSGNSLALTFIEGTDHLRLTPGETGESAWLGPYLRSGD